MATLSTPATHARTQCTGGLSVDTGGRQAPGTRRLGLVAAAVVVGVSLETAESLAGQTGWLVALVALSVAIAVGAAPRRSPRTAAPESSYRAGTDQDLHLIVTVSLAA
jgi:hypothetical protein